MPRARRIGAALLVALIAAAITIQSPTARAASPTTPPVSVTLPVRATSWNDSVSVPRFDPAMGELQAVHVAVDARMEGTIALENLGASVADDVQARAAAAATVARPGGATITTSGPGVTITTDLDAYDGTHDHDGASGYDNDVHDNHTVTTSLTDSADLALFTGTIPITLPTSGTDASVSPADLAIDVEITTRIGATVSVSYTYLTDERPPDAPIIESSPSAFTADPDPVITFTHEAGATAECQLTTPMSSEPWAACASPWQGHLAATGDGPYTFSVRATDLTGNVSEVATRTFTLDRVAPAQPTLGYMQLGPIPLLGRWTFTIEPGATARCALDGATAAPCTSPVTIDLSTLLDGGHTFSVHAVDAAGNAGPPASHTHDLDRAAPDAPTITGEPASPGNDPTPTWTFDLAADATTATCSIDGGAPTACTSPFTANLTAAVDGPHTFSVRNADAAGNPSGAATGTYTLDRTLPDAPTITGPPSPSNDPTPEWSITGAAGDTTECRLDDGPWTACDGSYSTTFTAGSDGVHVFTARATDAAGNLGPEATSTYVLDTTAPPAPTFLAAPADPSNNPLPTWTFSIDGWSQASCSFDGGPWAPCTSPHQVNLTAVADGPHSLSVRATDPVGNTGIVATRGFVLDRTAPTPPVITGSPVSPGNAATVTFTFSTPPGTTTRCRIDTGAPFDCSGSVTTTLLTDGEHRFGVRAVDQAGNPSSSAEAFYTLDRVAPAAPSITEAPASPTRSSTPRWSFTYEDGSTGECRIDGGVWTPCSSSYNADLSGASDGDHVFQVRATDAAGNVGAPASGGLVLDRTPPAAPAITSGPAAHTDDDTPSWTFTVEDGAVARCRLDDGPWTSCHGTITDDLRGALDGIHTLEVRAIDALGNEGPTTLAVFDLDRHAPDAGVFTSTPATPGNDPTPAWAFTYEPGTTAWCSLDGGEATECDGAFTAALLPDGPHQLTLTIVDAAGNTSATSTTAYDLDTVAPATPLVTAPRTPDRDETPEWLISLEDGMVAECSLDGAEPVACASVFGADLTGADGNHELVVVARDVAGNVSAPATSTYLLDTVAPAAPVMLHIPDAASWTWRFSIEPGATAECSVNGVPWTTCASGMAGGTPDQPVRFDVRAADRAGNRSDVTSVRTTPTRAVTVPPVPPPTPPRPPAPTETPIPAGEEAVAPRALTPPAVRPAARAVLEPEASGEADRRIDRRPWQDNGLFAGPVRDLLEAAAESTTIPALVVVVVLAFVAVQNRIDRRDPKLAEAPLRHEPEYLEFE